MVNKRRVGNTPFDLEAFFQLSDSMNSDTRTTETTFADFRALLRKLCAGQMRKDAIPARSSLAVLVGETCIQRWKLMSNQPYPFTEVEKKPRRGDGISREQNLKIKGDSLKTPADLVDYLRSVKQLPAPRVETLLSIPVKGLAATSSTAPSAPAVLPVPPSSDLPLSTSTEAVPTMTSRPEDAAAQTAPPISAPPKEGPAARAETQKIHVQKLELNQTRAANQTEEKECVSSDQEESRSKTPPVLNEPVDSSDDEPYIGPTSITHYDHWAIPDPQWPGCYLEAPKMAGCGPWEIPLPEGMDPEAYIAPDLKQVLPFLGNIQLAFKAFPPSLTVVPRAEQRASILADTCEDRPVEKDITTLRWKAYRLLSLWASHLRKHAKPPADPPMTLLDFLRRQTREDSHKEGEVARDFIVSQITKKNRRGHVLFPGRNYQLPKLPSVTQDVTPPSTLGVKRRRSTTYSPTGRSLSHPITLDEPFDRTYSDVTRKRQCQQQPPSHFSVGFFQNLVNKASGVPMHSEDRLRAYFSANAPSCPMESGFPAAGQPQRGESLGGDGNEKKYIPHFKREATQAPRQPWDSDGEI